MGAPQATQTGQRRGNPAEVSTIMERDGDFVSVTDLDTAAYLFCKGLALARAVQIGRPGRPGRAPRFQIRFYDPEMRALDLGIEFVNSPCARYADHVRRLKQSLERMQGEE